MHTFTCVSPVCVVSLPLLSAAWCILVFGVVPCVQVPPWPLLLHRTFFLSQTDNFFTPHQRRLLPAERNLSALFCPPSIFPTLLCLFSPFHLMCSSSTRLHLTSCTESRICTMEKINTLSSVQTASLYSVLSTFLISV